MIKKTILLSLLLVFTLIGGAYSQAVWYTPGKTKVGKTKPRYIESLYAAKGLKPFHSADMTVGVTMPTNLTLTLASFNSDSRKPESYAVQTFQYRTKAHYTLTGMTQLNIWELNPTNAFAFFYGANADLNLGDVQISDSFRLINSSNSYNSIEYMNYNLRIPLGLAYKTGATASLDKADRYSLAIGAGLAPSFMSTGFYPGGDFFNSTKLSITPYYFAEIGIFAGMNWKVRVAMIPRGYGKAKGNSTIATGFNQYINYDYSGSGNLYQITFGYNYLSGAWNDSRW